MYYVMHIPTGQFLYRLTGLLHCSKDEVCLYTEYEFRGRNIRVSRFICKDVSDLNDWFEHSKEILQFSDDYTICRDKKYLPEFTLIPIQE